MTRARARDGEMDHWWEFKGQRGQPSQARADHGGGKQAVQAKGEDSSGCTAARSQLLLCLGREQEGGGRQSLLW